MRRNHPFVSNFLSARREATPFKILSDFVTHLHNSLVVFTSFASHFHCLERRNLNLCSWGDYFPVTLACLDQRVDLTREMCFGPLKFVPR